MPVTQHLEWGRRDVYRPHTGETFGLSIEICCTLDAQNLSPSLVTFHTGNFALGKRGTFPLRYADVLYLREECFGIGIDLIERHG